MRSEWLGMEWKGPPELDTKEATLAQAACLRAISSEKTTQNY